VLNKNILDLINKKIDNIITIEEEHELNEYFKINPYAVKEYEAIKSLSGYFRDNEIIPPSELKANVMTNIQKIHSQKTNSKSIIIKTFESIKSWGKPQIAYPFAVGALAALLVATFIFQPSGIIDSNGLGGTFVFKSVEDIPKDIISEKLSMLSSENTISVSNSNNLTIVRLNFDTDNLINFNFSIDSQDAQFGAFEKTEKSTGMVSVEGNIISINQSGIGEYTFFFKNINNSSFVIDYRITSEEIDITEKLHISDN